MFDDVRQQLVDGTHQGRAVGALGKHRVSHAQAGLAKRVRVEADLQRLALRNKSKEPATLAAQHVGQNLTGSEVGAVVTGHAVGDGRHAVG